jgi:acetyltransferase EpsM
VTPRRLVVLGAGEHARVVSEAALAAGWESVEHVDAAGEAQLARELAAVATDLQPWLILGFGVDLEARREAVDRLPRTAHWAVVIHPAAWVSPSARLEPGTVVLAGAVVNTGAHLGPHAIVNSGAIVEHDVEIGSHAHVAPAATIGGGTRIGDGAFIGLGASVRDHVAIGDRATVGMGAVVVDDVPPGTTVIGVPARPAEHRGDRS